MMAEVTAKKQISVYDKSRLVEEGFAAFGKELAKARITEVEDASFKGQFPKGLEEAAARLKEASEVDKTAAMIRGSMLLDASQEWVKLADVELNPKTEFGSLKRAAEFLDRAADAAKEAGDMKESDTLAKRELEALKEEFLDEVNRYSEHSKLDELREAKNKVWVLAKQVSDKKELGKLAMELFDACAKKASEMHENKKYREAIDLEAFAADIAQNELNDGKLQADQLTQETQDIGLLAVSIKRANPNDAKQLGMAGGWMARAADIMKNLEKSLGDEAKRGATLYSNEAGTLYQLAGDAVVEKDPFEAVKWYETAISAFLKFGNEYAANVVQDGKTYRDAKRRTLAPEKR